MANKGKSYCAMCGGCLAVLAVVGAVISVVVFGIWGCVAMANTTEIIVNNQTKTITGWNRLSEDCGEPLSGIYKTLFIFAFITAVAVLVAGNSGRSEDSSSQMCAVVMAFIMAFVHLGLSIALHVYTNNATGACEDFLTNVYDIHVTNLGLQYSYMVLSCIEILVGIGVMLVACCSS